MPSFPLGPTPITDASPAYVVAEIGNNHGGSADVACKMIRVAAACGANAVKQALTAPVSA